MEERIRQLEERIRQLEKPTKLTEEWKKLLMAEGYLKYRGELSFTSAANILYQIFILEAFGNPFTVVAGSLSDYNEFKVDVTNNTIISKNHGLADDKQIDFYSNGQLPGGIDAPGIVYWVVNPTQDTFQVALTAFGTPIDITSGGIGVHYWKYFT